MAVNAVEGNRQSCLVPMAKGAMIGAAAGYVLKYAQPLTPQEKKNPEYIKVITKINNERTAFNPKTESYLNSIRAKGNMSPAEDTFVKLFDGLKEGDHVKKSSILKALRDLEGKDVSQVASFKRICKESAQTAKETADQCIKSYKLLTKHARPTSFFLIAGAVTGAIIAMVNSILKTDVKH